MDVPPERQGRERRTQQGGEPASRPRGPALDGLDGALPEGGGGDDWIITTTVPVWGAHRLRELRQHRELDLFLAVRDLQVRFERALGISWAVVQPPAGAVVAVVIRHSAGVPSGGVPHLGVGMSLATPTVDHRAAHFAVGLLTQLRLFASPVGHPSDLVPDRRQLVHRPNPSASALEGRPCCPPGARPPSASALLGLLVGLALLAVGLAHSLRSERRSADVV